MIKSIIRIGGCIAAIIANSIIVLAICFGIAEFLGIAEEFVDKRGKEKAEPNNKTIINGSVVVKGDVTANGFYIK